MSGAADLGAKMDWSSRQEEQVDGFRQPPQQQLHFEGTRVERLPRELQDSALLKIVIDCAAVTRTRGPSRVAGGRLEKLETYRVVEVLELRLRSWLARPQLLPWQLLDLPLRLTKERTP